MTQSENKIENILFLDFFDLGIQTLLEHQKPNSHWEFLVIDIASLIDPK